MKAKKVICYVDGFNLYFGLKSKNWRKYYWLDLVSLSKKLLKDDQVLTKVKYFTARIEHPEDKRRRQVQYLEALDTLPELEIFYGKFLSNPVTCKKCGYEFYKKSEKETDVNIAVELLTDAVINNYDTALLITGDSDLVPAIRRVKELYPKKRIISIFPPQRSSFALKNISDGNFVLAEHKIKKSQFPDQLTNVDDYIILRPEMWY